MCAQLYLPGLYQMINPTITELTQADEEQDKCAQLLFAPTVPNIECALCISLIRLY